MSWVLITTIIILLVLGFIGWHKGILKIVLSFAAMIVTLLATILLAPVVSNYIIKNTEVYNAVNSAVEKVLTDSSTFDRAYEESLGSDTEDELEELGVTSENISSEGLSELQQYFLKVIEEMNFPKEIMDGAANIITGDMISSLENDGKASIKQMIIQMIADRVTRIIINAIVHIVVFVVVFVVLKVVISISGVISRLPVIHQADKLLGLFLGIIEGVICVWLMFAVITACGHTQWGMEALKDITGNPFLSFMYNNNFIMNSIFKL